MTRETMRRLVTDCLLSEESAPADCCEFAPTDHGRNCVIHGRSDLPPEELERVRRVIGEVLGRGEGP